MMIARFFVQAVDDLTDGHDCVLAHDLDIVEDGAVRLHRLADAVLERLQGYAQLEAVLYEALACGVERQAVVDAQALIEKGIIHDCKYGLKVLSNGKLEKKLTVKAAAFSESAKAKIEQAGGKAEVV